MPWNQLIFEPGPVDVERLEAALEATGAVAVTLQAAADEPILEPPPGATPLWKRTRVTALYDAPADIDRIRTGLCAELHVDALPPHRIGILSDRQWEREWLRHAKPLRFGARLWICPGDTAPSGDEAVVVRLDPGLAFGAGTHPSTALCLDWLAIHDLHGAKLIDYGCGSGILAIAALRLGARCATAFDIDPQARTATRANALHNGVADALVVTDCAPSSPSSCDVLLANILAGTLIEMAGRLAALVSPAGRLVLSGILDAQGRTVADAYRTWFDIEGTQEREDWIRIDAIRRP